MNPAKEYTLYARSRIYTFVLFLVYGFCSLVLLGGLLNWSPNLNAWCVLSVFAALMFISFCLAQITARPRIQISLYPDRFETEWQRRVLFFRKPNRVVGFDMVASYSASDNFFKIRLTDRSKYELCKKRFILGKANTLIQFEQDFILANQQWKSAGDIPRPSWPAKPATTNSFAIIDLNGEVVSRRGATFYFSIIFGAVFLGAMGLGIMAIAFSEKNVLVALGSLVIFLITYYTISRYYRCAPIIRCSVTGISFNKQFHPWNDVQAVELTGSQPFKIFGGYAMEGAKIEFTNGETRYMLDGLYNNLNKIKSFMDQVVPGKIVIPEQNKNALATSISILPPVAGGTYAPDTGEEVKYVKGKPYTNAWAIFMWLIIGCLVGVAPFLTSSGDDVYGTMVFFLIPSAGFYFLLTIHFNHFGLSGRYFIVKNVYRPWKKKIFLLKDIREIVLASNQHGVDTLRVIFSDFRSKEFGATGLRNSDWLNLINLIQSRGILLKDENDFALWSTPEMKKSYRKMVFYFILYFFVCIVAYVFVLECHLGDTAMLFLKLGWLLFIVVAFLGLIKLIVWQDRRNEKKKETKDAAVDNDK